jgi:hypothetical protein
MLRQAGVPVTATRYQGIIHDFVVLNALRGTQAAEAVINQAIVVLRKALHASWRLPPPGGHPSRHGVRSSRNVAV